MTDTLLRVRTIMEQAHAHYEREVEFYAEIRRILVEKFVGKRVDTKHTTNYITKLHPTWTVNLQHMSNHVNLRVWGGDSGYKDWNDYGRIMLGYDNECLNFDPALMDKHNIAIENAKREIERIEAFLNSPATMQNIVHGIDAYKAVTETTKELLGNCPEHYALEKLAGLRD